MNETLYLEATAAAAAELTPGAVLRSLALHAGVFAEEITALHPLGARRVAVTLTGARARALNTPQILTSSGAVRADGAGVVTWILRRPEDPPEDGTLTALATWSVGDEGAEAPPAPGALARALHAALGPDVGTEELGVGFVGLGFAQLSLPSRLATLGLPEELALPDGRAVRLAPVTTPGAGVATSAPTEGTA